MIKGIRIRSAQLGEEDFRSSLAIRSKGYWGYSIEFLDACRPHIKIDAAYIKEWPVQVLDSDGTIIGFYSLKVINGEKRLDNLWIEPSFIKHGFGKMLFAHAVLEAKKLGWSSFRLAGEPAAVPFYERMGAKLIGQIQSRLRTDLFLPHMELNF
jgi:GNAT superfamily N-acetyltransferase